MKKVDDRSWLSCHLCPLVLLKQTLELHRHTWTISTHILSSSLHSSAKALVARASIPPIATLKTGREGVGASDLPIFQSSRLPKPPRDPDETTTTTLCVLDLPHAPPGIRQGPLFGWLPSFLWRSGVLFCNIFLVCARMCVLVVRLSSSLL